MASENKRKYRLQELSGSDFEMVEGEPDIRGWDVKLSSGEEIGEVDELIFDAHTRKIRYMVIEVDDSDDLDLDEREVLIPIGMASLDSVEEEVTLNNITPAHLRALPDYDEDNLRPEVERAVCAALGRTGVNAGNEIDEEFYHHDHFNKEYRIRERRGFSGTEVEGYSGGAGLQSRDEDFEEERKRQDRMQEESLLVNRDRSEDPGEGRMNRDQFSGTDRSDEEWNRRNEERKRRDERTGNTGL